MFSRLFWKHAFVKLIFSFIIAIQISTSVKAADILSIKIKATDKIATYIGTFSPPHHRHEEIVEGVLKSGLVDYVVVLANDLNFHKPDALDFHHRQQMLWELYQDHPRVLVIRYSDDFIFSTISRVTQYLRGKGVKLFGILGLDSFRNFKTRLAAQFSRRDAWIVTSANELRVDEKTESHLASAPIQYLAVPLQGEDVRSSSMRSALADGHYENLPLHPAVLEYIKKEELYKNPTALLPLTKKVGFCARQLFRFFVSNGK